MEGHKNEVKKLYLFYLIVFRVEENPGIDSALLLVRYPNSTNAELIMSPLLTKSLGNITLPP